MRISGLVVGLVALAGCKKSYEEQKKQAMAIREKAFACADVECAKAAEAEYYKLTSGLRDLPKADADFFFGENNMNVDIRKRVRELGERPPAVVDPTSGQQQSSDASSKRTKVTGFSVALPTGWETHDMTKRNILLAATKGDNADSSTFVVKRVPKTAEFAAKAACEERLSQQASALDGEAQRAALLDLGGSTACVVSVKRDKRQSLIAFIPSSKEEIFYAMCDVPAGAENECAQVIESWKSE